MQTTCTRLESTSTGRRESSIDQLGRQAASLVLGVCRSMRITSVDPRRRRRHGPR